jgi:hypothetical protein
MLKSFLALPALALSTAINSAFTEYIEKFGKTYASEEEYLMREQIFLKNDEFIRAHN